MKVVRKVWLLVFLALPALGGVGPAVGAQSDLYQRDVEFLLVELEKHAGHFFGLKGIDWSEVSRQFRAEVKTVTNDVDQVRLCWRLLTQLRDGHARIRDAKVRMPDESQNRRWTGPRAHLVVIEDRVYVRQAFGSAAEAGVKVGMEVVRINRVPARQWLTHRVAAQRYERSYSTSHQALYAVCHWGLADWAGTTLEFDLRNNGEARTVKLTRQGGSNFVPFGPVFLPPGIQRLGRQSYGKTADGFGYIHLRDVPGNLPQQLDMMLKSLGEVPGLILDLRANGGGGCDHEAVFGRFVPVGKNWRQYRGAGENPFSGPMVVIVDSGTRSAGETVAGMFKEDGRACLIGDGPTAGTSSQKKTLTVPSGLLSVYFSVSSNKQRFNNGQGIEGIGVAPHQKIPYDPGDLRSGVDTLIRRAEEMLRQGLPKDQVPFEQARSNSMGPN